MLSAMDRDTAALERAFQLASSGDHRSIGDIKQRLKAEGYSVDQITGSALKKQLRTLIRSAPHAMARSEPPT
jgi:hypothetical protein